MRGPQLALFDAPPEAAPLGAVETWGARTGRTLIGVDEAGRGPLAGPVVAAAVVLPGLPLPAALRGLDDSKKLCAATRARLSPVILSVAQAVGVAIVHADRIDAINILGATREAMRRAVTCARRRLRSDRLSLLVDGNLPLPGYDGEQWALVKGDGRSFAIAAASVVAKTLRDRIMIQLARRYPGYGFEQHKGYGTRAHRAALARLGPSAIHRRSFRWRAPGEDPMGEGS